MLADRTIEAAPDEPVLDDALELNPRFLCKLGEVSDLQVPSCRWEGFSEQLENSGFLKRLEPQLVAWLDAQNVVVSLPSIEGVQEASEVALRPARSVEERDRKSTRLNSSH